MEEITIYSHFYKEYRSIDIDQWFFISLFLHLGEADLLQMQCPVFIYYNLFQKKIGKFGLSDPNWQVKSSKNSWFSITTQSPTECLINLFCKKQINYKLSRYIHIFVHSNNNNNNNFYVTIQLEDLIKLVKLILFLLLFN